MRLALCLALHFTRAAWLAPPASRVAWRASEPRADVSTAPLSLFPAWPASTERQLTPTLEAYEALVDVPLRASGGDGWREWSEAGCAANKLVASKLSRNTYLEVLQTLFAVLVGSQQRYPDLWAVLKFVPKKNGLNPLLQRVSEGDLEALSLEGQRAREVRRRLDDLQRAFEQTWLLLCAYLTLPSSELREDAMWAARTLVEKVKTDQRSRALELLCLGVYYRGSALFGLVSHGRSAWTLRAGFEDNFGGDAWHPKPTNARMIWQRCRMVYPLLEIAHRAWLRASGRWDGARGPTRDDGAAIAVLLDSIARAGPEEKVADSSSLTVHCRVAASLQLWRTAPPPAGDQLAAVLAARSELQVDARRRAHPQVGARAVHPRPAGRRGADGRRVRRARPPAPAAHAVPEPRVTREARTA